MENGSWWALGLGRRILMAAEFILWPLKLIALLIEIAVGGIFLGMIGLVVAWWMRIIPDQDVVSLIDALSNRGMAILRAQGVFHIPGCQGSNTTNGCGNTSIP